MRIASASFIGLVLATLVAATDAQAYTWWGPSPLIYNPSFETQYTGGLPRSWYRQATTGTISTALSGTTTNGIDGSYAMFVASGETNTGSVYTSIQTNGTGALSTTKQYWVQVFYAKSTLADPSVAVSYGPLATAQSLGTLNTSDFAALGGTSTYGFVNYAFTPTSALTNPHLNFTSVGAASTTARIDCVTIIQRDADEVVLMNPSFEGSSMLGDGTPRNGSRVGTIAGWTTTNSAGVVAINVSDSNTGIISDNGITNSYAAAFMDQNGEMSQTITGLTVGAHYQLSYLYNATSAATAHIEATIGDLIAQDADVTAVGGTNLYNTNTYEFTATAASMLLDFQQTAASARLLLDNISVKFLSGPSYHDGDANGDSWVDFTDLTTVLGSYNQSDKAWANGDFNADGWVDFTDLTTVLQYYNQSFGASASSRAVPEPSTLLLTVAGLVGLLAYAWRKRK